jgi:hypothetical protein
MDRSSAGATAVIVVPFTTTTPIAAWRRPRYRLNPVCSVLKIVTAVVRPSSRSRLEREPRRFAGGGADPRRRGSDWCR